MRWKAVILMLAVAGATVTGCAQRCFLTKESFDDFHARNILPPTLETDPTLGSEPVTGHVPKPATVEDPERKPRYVTLHECVAIALEHGSTGIQSVRQPGAINEDLQAPLPTGGFQLLNSDSIRVLALNPAIAGLNIDASLARFDAKWVTSVNFGVQDQPIQGFNSFSNGDNGRFASTLVKQLAGGGIAGITFNNQYQFLNNPPRGFPILNPAYTPRAALTYEQPLWQGAGTEINQLLSRSVQLGTELNRSHPEASAFLNGHLNGLQNSSSTTGGGLNQTGLLISRLRFDQSRAALGVAINFTLLNTEIAYWNLYGAFVNLYSSEQALRQSYQTWRISKAKFEAGVEKFAITQFAQTRGQYEQFRGDRLQALGRVLEAERILRALTGLPAEDGCRLIPVDAPSLAPVCPNWDVAVEEALTLRPELVAARQELKALQFDVMVQKNFLKPDIRALMSYGVDGLGTRLDGNGQVLDSSQGRSRTDNAWRSLASTHFNDWDIGLVYNVPLGYRFEYAAVRRARLALAQGFLAVQREEEKARLFLSKAYREVIESYSLIKARRAQRMAFAEQVQARSLEFVAGKTTADFLLEAQRQFANSLSTEYQAVVAYNNSLATYEFAKGTIMEHDNVKISEGPLPQCVAVSATDYERERSKAIVLRERAHPIPHPMSAENDTAGLPLLPTAEAPSLPALLEGAPKLPEKLEDAPPPQVLPKVAGPEKVWHSVPPAPVAAAAPAKETVLVFSTKRPTPATPAKAEEKAAPTLPAAPTLQAAPAVPVLPTPGQAANVFAVPPPAASPAPTTAAVPVLPAPPGVPATSGLPLPTPR